MGETKVRPDDVDEIGEDDFYRRNAEFKAFLIEHDRHFDELSADKARHHFSKFVDRWNAGRVSRKVYYLRRHNNANGSRRTQPDAVYTCSFDWKKKRMAKELERPPVAEPSPKMGAADKKRADKQFSKRVRQDEEELAPRADPGSYQARLEKRRKASQLQGGDDAFGSYDDSTLMGGDDDFKAALKRKEGARDARVLEKKRHAEERIQELQAKERERMESFKTQLGL